jgi:hypothetical protein
MAVEDGNIIVQIASFQKLLGSSATGSDWMEGRFGRHSGPSRGGPRWGAYRPIEALQTAVC